MHAGVAAGVCLTFSCPGRCKHPYCACVVDASAKSQECRSAIVGTGHYVRISVLDPDHGISFLLKTLIRKVKIAVINT